MRFYIFTLEETFHEVHLTKDHAGSRTRYVAGRLFQPKTVYRGGFSADGV